MSLTAAQEEALVQLHAITNTDDIERERHILESCNWDKAIQAIYDVEDEPPAPRASSSTTASEPGPSSASARRIEEMDVDDSMQEVGPPARPIRPTYPTSYTFTSRIVAILTYPLTVSFSLLANIVQFVFRLLRLPFPRLNTGSLRFSLLGGSAAATRRPPRPSDPKAAAERWVRELEDETGALSVSRAAAAATGGSNGNAMDSEGLRKRSGESKGRLIPDFWVGGFESAFKAAQTDAKVLCVILVSEEHDDTPAFKKDVLTDPDFVRVLSDNGFIVWAGDVRDSDAYQCSLKLTATTYPFVAFISLHPRSGGRSTAGSAPVLSVISRHEGSPATTTSAVTLTNHITNTLVPRVTPLLTRLKNEARNRQMERDLRAEQDRAFRVAEQRDKERMEKRIAEERKKREEEANKQREEEERRMKQTWQKQWRRWQKANLPLEPPAGTPGALRIGVRAPNGQRRIRHFNSSDPVRLLYTFVDVDVLADDDGSEPAPTSPPAGYKPDFDFVLATAYPRSVVPLSEGTLGDISTLKGGANLVVEASSPAPSEDSDEDEEDDD